MMYTEITYDSYCDYTAHVNEYGFQIPEQKQNTERYN